MCCVTKASNYRDLKRTNGINIKGFFAVDAVTLACSFKRIQHSLLRKNV